MKIELKPGVKPFSIQVEDLKLVCQNSHFANFSEMGAGKSLPHALLAKGVLDDGLCDIVLIVTPKIVLSDWHDIFRYQMECNHKQLVQTYHAPAVLREGMPLAPINILTYDTLLADINRFVLAAQNRRMMLVLDEAHYIRNHTSGRHKASANLAAYCKRVYLLTGTPLPNGLKNAYAYIQLMRPNVYYRSFEHFQRRHMRFSPHNRRVLIGYEEEETIADILASFSVRHLKREVHDLPPVTYKQRRLEWDPVQRKLYEQFLEESILELEDRFLEATSIGAMLARSHQMITNPMQLGLPCDSTRFTALDDDLESIGLADHKVVIFAHFRHTIERLKKQLKDYNPAVIYGGTSDVDTQKAKFKEDDSCRIMLANPLSAGVGTNFSIADYCIFFEYTYDLDSFDQGVSRLDRPGQKNAITVLVYGLRGSMEELRIQPALIGKKQLSMSALRDPKELISFLQINDDADALNF